MDAALRLGDRHPLHAVWAALVLHAAPHALALQQERDLVEATHVGRVGLEDVGLPAHAVGVAHVHVEEILGEEVRLLTALRAAYLHDHVLALVRVLRQEEETQLLLQPGDGELGLVDLGAHEVAVVPRGLGKHPSGRFEVVACLAIVAVGEHDGLELLVPPRRLEERARVGDHLVVGESREHVVILRLEGSQPVQHGLRVVTAANASRRAPSAPRPGRRATR